MKEIVENIKCPKCTEIKLNKCSLSKHLQKNHDLTKEEAKAIMKQYSNIITKLEEMTISKNKQTKKERYGSENYNNIDKNKQTIMEKYGVENVFQAKEVKEIKKKTIMEKYGVQNVFQAKEVKEKIKETIQEKYGVNNIMHNEEIKQKHEELMRSKYNGQLLFETDEFKNNVKQYYIDKLGVDNPLKSTEIKDKVKQTNLDRYGYEWGLSSPETQQKITETCQEKYGVNRATQTDEVKQKSYETSLEHYGSWFSQTDAHQKCMYHRKEYKFPSGQIIYVQGFENLALDILLQKYNEEDIYTFDKVFPFDQIWYEYENKPHRYFPDIYVKSIHTIFEVKSEYTYQQEYNKNNAKMNGTIQSGFNVNLILFNQKGELVSNEPFVLI